MTLVVIADEESFLADLSPERADVVIACGDLIDPAILQTATAVQCSKVFAVKGNHDTAGPFPAPILDLHLQTKRNGGLLFGGFQGAWKYKPRGHFLYEQEEARRLLSVFPAVDVFVAHNSLRHIHDREDDIHFGFDALADYIHRAQPRLFFHGHQHLNRETVIGRTRVIGVYGQRRFEI